MSEQDSLKAGGWIHYEYCRLQMNKSYCMQSGFEREPPFIAECKHCKETSDLNNTSVDVVKENAGIPVNACLMVENKGDANDIVDSDTEDSPTEDLRRALEVDLSIISADTQDFSISQTETADDFICKDKKKKRKKRKGSIRNPNQIFAFNEEEQQKIEESKTSADGRKAMMNKSFCKSATFPGLVSSKDMLNVKDEKFGNVTVNGQQSECGSPDVKKCLNTRANSLPSSFKLIPAMRGGHELNGLGPRPKLCVKWAPDVQEPPWSSVSHTVRSHHHHQSKKKDHKHKHKGKLAHASGSDKNDKKHMYNSRQNTEGVPSRLQSSSAQHADNRIFLDVLPSRGSTLMPDKSRLIALKAPLFNMQMGQNGLPLNIVSKPSDHDHRNGGDDFVEKCTNDFVSEVKGNSSESLDVEFPFLQDSKCASSFLRTFQSKQLSYAEAT
eukprot:Gb_21764 [translate_table: standard]